MRSLFWASLLLAASAAQAQAPTPAAVEQLLWDYAEFSQLFADGNWRAIERFVTPESKMGFGGEQGREGLRQVFAANPACSEAMVFALRQGCRKVQRGDAVACVAPPQWADSEVVYLGARAEFVYNPSRERWVVGYLICGGD